MLESFRVNTPKPIFVRKIQINTNTKSSFHIKVQIQAFLYLQWLRCPVSDVSFDQEKKAVFMWFCILLHFPPRLVSYALDAWYASFALNISVTVYLAHPALPDMWCCVLAGETQSPHICWRYRLHIVSLEFFYFIWNI